VKKDKETPYIYHLGTTAYRVSSGSAETMTDDELIKSAASGFYCKDFILGDYVKVPRGQTGTLWRKVAA
jgi:hypothetical protein